MLSPRLVMEAVIVSPNRVNERWCKVLSPYNSSLIASEPYTSRFAGAVKQLAGVRLQLLASRPEGYVPHAALPARTNTVPLTNATFPLFVRTAPKPFSEKVGYPYLAILVPDVLRVVVSPL